MMRRFSTGTFPRAEMPALRELHRIWPTTARARHRDERATVDRQLDVFDGMERGGSLAAELGDIA
jgi:hypothetical protein